MGWKSHPAAIINKNQEIDYEKNKPLSIVSRVAYFWLAFDGCRSEGRYANLFPPSVEVPRTCNLGTFATVTAGVDGSGNPSATAQFPKVITCPNSEDANCPIDFGGSGPYLRWDYAYSFSGSNPSLALLTVSIDTPLLYTSPTAVLSTSCNGDTSTRTAANTCERKALRFTANSSTYKAFYLTPLPALILSRQQLARKPEARRELLNGRSRQGLGGNGSSCNSTNRPESGV